MTAFVLQCDRQIDAGRESLITNGVAGEQVMLYPSLNCILPSSSPTADILTLCQTIRLQPQQTSFVTTISSAGMASFRQCLRPSSCPSLDLVSTSDAETLSSESLRHGSTTRGMNSSPSPHTQDSAQQLEFWVWEFVPYLDPSVAGRKRRHSSSDFGTAQQEYRDLVKSKKFSTETGASKKGAHSHARSKTLGRNHSPLKKDSMTPSTFVPADQTGIHQTTLTTGSATSCSYTHASQPHPLRGMPTQQTFMALSPMCLVTRAEHLLPSCRTASASMFEEEWQSATIRATSHASYEGQLIGSSWSKNITNCYSDLLMRDCGFEHLATQPCATTATGLSRSGRHTSHTDSASSDSRSSGHLSSNEVNFFNPAQPYTGEHCGGDVSPQACDHMSRQEISKSQAYCEADQQFVPNGPQHNSYANNAYVPSRKMQNSVIVTIQTPPDGSAQPPGLVELDLKSIPRSSMTHSQDSPGHLPTELDLQHSQIKVETEAYSSNASREYLPWKEDDGVPWSKGSRLSNSIDHNVHVSEVIDTIETSSSARCASGDAPIMDRKHVCGEESEVTTHSNPIHLNLSNDNKPSTRTKHDVVLPTLSDVIGPENLDQTLKSNIKTEKQSPPIPGKVEMRKQWTGRPRRQALHRTCSYNLVQLSDATLHKGGSADEAGEDEDTKLPGTVSASMKWTEDNVHRLISMKDDGKPWSSIAAALGRSERACQLKYTAVMKSDRTSFFDRAPAKVNTLLHVYDSEKKRFWREIARKIGCSPKVAEDKVMDVVIESRLQCNKNE